MSLLVTVDEEIGGCKPAAAENCGCQDGGGRENEVVGKKRVLSAIDELSVCHNAWHSSHAGPEVWPD